MLYTIKSFCPFTLSKAMPGKIIQFQKFTDITSFLPILQFSNLSFYEYYRLDHSVIGKEVILNCVISYQLGYEFDF